MKINFKNKHFTSLSHISKEYDYDEYSLKLYRKQHNLSTYQILQRIDTGTINEKLFQSKGNTKRIIKEKERLSYLNLLFGNNFSVLNITYENILEFSKLNKISINTIYKKLSKSEETPINSLESLIN